jgi:rhodanese-related sulfurtransferase
LTGFPAIQPNAFAVDPNAVPPVPAVPAGQQPTVIPFVVPVEISPSGYPVASAPVVSTPIPDSVLQQYDAATIEQIRQQQQLYAARIQQQFSAEQMQQQGQQTMMVPGQQGVRQFPPDQIVPPQPPQQTPGYPAQQFALPQNPQPPQELQAQAFILPAQPQQPGVLPAQQPFAAPVFQPVPPMMAPAAPAVPVVAAPGAPSPAFAHPMPAIGYAATLGTPVAGRENLSIITPAEVRQALSQGVQLILLDVRDELVRDIEGHIDGDVHVPFGPYATFANRVRRVIPGAAYPVVVYCSDGVWSSQAADVMARMGYRVYLMGAYPLWLRG